MRTIDSPQKSQEFKVVLIV